MVICSRVNDAIFYLHLRLEDNFQSQCSPLLSQQPSGEAEPGGLEDDERWSPEDLKVGVKAD